MDTSRVRAKPFVLEEVLANPDTAYNPDTLRAAAREYVRLLEEAAVLKRRAHAIKRYLFVTDPAGRLRSGTAERRVITPSIEGILAKENGPLTSKSIRDALLALGFPSTQQSVCTTLQTMEERGIIIGLGGGRYALPGQALKGPPQG